MVSVTALLVVGVAGAAVHEDEADNAVASALDDPKTAASAGSAPTSTPMTTTVTISPSTSTSTTTAVSFAPETLAGPAGAAASGSGGPAGAASPAGPSDAAGTTASGSATAATGNGEIASVGPPLADTGSYPLAVPGALLLALGGTGRALLRSASRATG